MDINTLVHLVIQLLIIGGIFWLLFWLVNYIAPPEPFRKILLCVIAVVAVLFLINVLLGLSGSGISLFRLR